MEEAEQRENKLLNAAIRSYPTKQFNAAASYGVGYIGADGNKGLDACMQSFTENCKTNSIPKKAGSPERKLTEARFEKHLTAIRTTI